MVYSVIRYKIKIGGIEMAKKVSPTERLRPYIAEFLKSKNGQPIQRKDLINHFISMNPVYTKNMFNGIFSKMRPDGRIYIPIAGVQFTKIGNQAFYRYTL